jgi:penicillin-binding protein 2
LASTGTRARLPRFLPPDPRVEEPYLFTPKLALRVAILAAIAFGVFGILLLRLWSLQILSGTHYLDQARDNQLRTVRTEAPRGPILDRYGRVLVTNAPGTAIDLWPADLPSGRGRDTELRSLSEILSMPLAEIQQRIRERRNDPLTPVTLRVAVHEDQVKYLLEHRGQFPGVRVRTIYLRHYNSQALAAQLLGYTTEISAAQLEQFRKQGLECPPLRPDSGAPNCYAGGDHIGQSGVEAAYEPYLRGEAATTQFRVNSRGFPTSTSAPELGRAPVPGDALRLTIDIGLQRAAERALHYGIDLARTQGHWAANGGAIVALDPNDGAILAMASAPTYKPSVYVGRTDPKKLAPLIDQKAAAEANYPALNRVTQGLYPPGSTFKPVTAIAAMQEHLISPYQTLQCTGSYTVHGETGQGQVFKNWDPFVNQPMTLPVAIGASCDTYFYQLGMMFYGLPASQGHPLQAWASRLGIGGLTGIDIGPEQRGLLPTPEWRQATYTKQSDPCCWQIDRIWKPGDSIQLAIGQKDLLVTPLQMARFYSLIANGGKLVTPHVAEDVEHPAASGMPPEILRRFDPPPPQPSGVDATALEAVQQGLYEATHAQFGTSSSVFGTFPVPVAGKTGTAEKVVQPPGVDHKVLLDQSWWCGYAPANAPKITVCALIENGGHGGTAAAPTALKVFEHYFNARAPVVQTNNAD